MGDVSWIKLKVGMFDDEKISLIESLPDKDAILIIWVRLLLQAGKTNANGYIFLTERVPYTDEMLASIFHRPLNTVRLALETFVKLEMIEIDEKGILVLNWEKHQNVEKLELIRENSRKRFKKWYDTHKLAQNSNNLTLEQTLSNTTDIDIDKEEEKEEESESPRFLWINIFTHNPGMVEVDFCKRLINQFGYKKAKTILYDLRRNNFHSVKTMEESLDAEGNIKQRENVSLLQKQESAPAAHKYLD